MSWFKKEADKPKIALVLTGGGAKTAYQVGVLKGITQLTPKSQGIPFSIISGSSAGAINAVVLASYANRYRIGMRRLESVWSNFHAHQVYRVGWAGLLTNTGRWIAEFLRSSHQSPKPLSLLINTPLKNLLRKAVPFDHIQQNVSDGYIDGISITAYSYQKGDSVSFFQASEAIDNWERHRRRGKRHPLHLNHLMASAAIPMVFPAVKINREYFGDGSIGCLSPLSPALHMGADRLLIISTDPIDEISTTRLTKINYPTMAEIAGRLMDSIFTDSLASDLERLKRINETIELIPGKNLKRNKATLRPIESLLFMPDFNIDQLASEHYKSLPRLLRFFLTRMGICEQEGSNILSYLLFESSFTKILIERGYQDALKRADEINAFLDLKIGPTNHSQNE